METIYFLSCSSNALQNSAPLVSKCVTCKTCTFCKAQWPMKRKSEKQTKSQQGRGKKFKCRGNISKLVDATQIMVGCRPRCSLSQHKRTLVDGKKNTIGFEYFRQRKLSGSSVHPITFEFIFMPLSKSTVLNILL